MSRLAARVLRLWSDEEGASHLEYALIAGFMGAALVAGLLVLQGGLSTFYTVLSGVLAAIL